MKQKPQRIVRLPLVLGLHLYHLHHRLRYHLHLCLRADIVMAAAANDRGVATVQDNNRPLHWADALGLSVHSRRHPQA